MVTNQKQRQRLRILRSTSNSIKTRGSKPRNFHFSKLIIPIDDNKQYIEQYWSQQQTMHRTISITTMATRKRRIEKHENSAWTSIEKVGTFVCYRVSRWFLEGFWHFMWEKNQSVTVIDLRENFENIVRNVPSIA